MVEIYGKLFIAVYDQGFRIFDQREKPEHREPQGCKAHLAYC